MDSTLLATIAGIVLGFLGVVFAAWQVILARRQLNQGRIESPPGDGARALTAAEPLRQPEPEFIAPPPLGPGDAGPDVLFDGFMTRAGEGRAVRDILARWKPDAGHGRPLIFITHFAADVPGLLSSARAHMDAMREGTWRPVEHRWVLGERVVNLDEWRKQSTIDEIGVAGWVLHGLLKAQPADSEELRRAWEYLQARPPTLFLINLFGAEPEALLQAHARAPSGDAVPVGRGIMEFCKWAAGHGHHVVLCMPRAALVLESLHELAKLFSETFIATDLFLRESPDGWPGREDLADPPSPGEFLRTLASAGGGALGREIDAFFDAHAEEEAEDGSAADPAGEFRLARLLSLAERLAREGFYEIAYRLELYCRTHGRTPDSVPLDADLIRLPKREDLVVGVINGIENAPAVVTRALLLGDAGTGKTTAMLRTEERWALPRGAVEGNQHPDWLPFYVPLGQGEGESFEEQLRAQFERNSKLQVEGVQELTLTAHSFLARLASLNNIRWLFSSPVLFLMDNADGLPPEQLRVVEEGLHRLEKVYPSAGVLVACRNEMVLEYKAAHWVQIRLLDGGQIAALLKAPADELFDDLLGVTDRAISYDIRTPFLLALLSEVRERAGRVEGWNLYRLMSLFVEHRVELEPPATSLEVVEEWLPGVALANKTRARAGQSPATSPASHLFRRAAEVGFLRPESGEGAAQFTHGLVEDFFAARELLNRIRREGAASVESLLPDPPHLWRNWRYVLRMVAGGLEKGLLGDFIEVVARRDLRVAHLCLLELPVEDAQGVGGAESIAGALVERIAARAADAQGALDNERIAQSISDAETLSFLDPRIRVDDPRAGLVEIAAADGGPSFGVGRYPVTNMEYALFVADRGYQREEWWVPPARRWLEQTGIRHPLYWHHERLNRPNQPVVGVTFYEALAYCLWLTHDLGAGGDCSFGLPTEGMWNRAVGLDASVMARVLDKATAGAGAGQSGGPGGATPAAEDADAFPAQDILDEAALLLRAHRRQLRHAEVTPVGLFSPTATGCYDMLGGVWEWCDSWAYGGGGPPAPSAEEGDPRLPVMVKGGPAEDEFRDILTIIGGWFDPYTRFHQIGFRVCCQARTGAV